jgi:hypothetical protein
MTFATKAAHAAFGPCYDDKETLMRLLILSVVLANAALMSVADTASAQSPTSYPWCSRSGDRDNYNNCYFTSKEQCQKTTSGIGAFCFENPYYRPSPSGRARTRQSTRE